VDAEDLAKLDIGRMIWLRQVIDTNGDMAGPHAAVILTTKEEQAAGEPIRAIVISSRFANVPVDQRASIPHSNRGRHPYTGLDRPSAAIGKWRITVNLDDVTRFGFVLSGRYMAAVTQCIEAAKAADRSTQS
jgi:hypothetical protein